MLFLKVLDEITFVENAGDELFERDGPSLIVILEFLADFADLKEQSTDDRDRVVELLRMRVIGSEQVVERVPKLNEMLARQNGQLFHFGLRVLTQQPIV